MRIQCLLIAAVINFKRLIAFLSPSQPLPEALQGVLVALWSYLIAIITFCVASATDQKIPTRTALSTK
jgi:hypothetical protein